MKRAQMKSEVTYMDNSEKLEKIISFFENRDFVGFRLFIEREKEQLDLEIDQNNGDISKCIEKSQEIDRLHTIYAIFSNRRLLLKSLVKSIEEYEKVNKMIYEENYIPEEIEMYPLSEMPGYTRE
jgi:hypothetical protein